jgi:hypothetical protein
METALKYPKEFRMLKALLIVPVMLAAAFGQKGLILPDTGYHSEEGMLFSSTDTLPCYTGSEDTTVAGFLFMEEAWSGLQYVPNHDEEEYAGSFSAAPIAWETRALKVHDVKNNRCAIHHSEKGDVWIDSTLLDNSGYGFVPYREFFKGLEYCHARRAEDSLTLRESPENTDNAIVTLMPENYEIEFSNEIRGEWALVTVYEYEDIGFHASRTGEMWEGWIQYLHDSGTPRVWFIQYRY